MSGNPAGAPSSPRGALGALTLLFFMWGLITSLNDILVPHLKALFTLSYFEAMLVQFSFFTAYFVMSLPAGALIRRTGYKGGILIGLGLAAAGCLMFYPAAGLRAYPLFLVALFVLACGITVLQVAANPYVTALGPPETASSRLNLTQAFNSLGTTLGPALGATFILSAAAWPDAGAASLSAAERVLREQAQVAAVQTPYVVLAGVLVAIAVFLALFRLPRVADGTATGAAAALPARRSVWAYPHLVLGALGIFAYVGAEVAIGSLLVSVMGLPEVAGLAPDVAGRYLSLYWGLAMAGRFIGGALMRVVRPGGLLGFNALANVALLLVAMLASGKVVMGALLAIGFFNSIMFPTIFSLALRRLGGFTSQGSGVLCMAIVGGAVVPLLQGFCADRIGLLASFAIPLLCYVYVAVYAARGARPR
ncbi:MAG: sugar MFS transporter [Candidatus Dactylopiibacterium sp.]|nr:sugar MFS transporter [Candidatus Dactylopiibacterium sp.]